MRFATANPAGMPFRAQATASRATAVLTSPCIAMATTKAAAREQQLAHAYDMAEVTLERHPLVATAGLAWNTDLPRPLQQILSGTAVSRLRSPRTGQLASCSRCPFRADTTTGSPVGARQQTLAGAVARAWR